MVRLLLIWDAYATLTQWFQFLNGTIITENGIRSFIKQIVSIPQWYDYYATSSTKTKKPKARFNSSMVRLLRWRADTLARFVRFQFLNGTIITYSFTDAPKVQTVSIPQWYDYYTNP